MPYLNLDLDYFDHPKTRRLVALLGNCSDLYPLRLWAYVGKYHAVDGRLKNYSVKEVEGVCGWCGNSGELVEKMLFVGYLAGDVGSFLIPDWKQHQGHIIAFKKRASLANSARWNKYYKHSSRTPKSIVKESPIPNLTIPNHTKPTIEDIRAHFLDKKSNQKEADKFFNYYESNGWKVGKNSMKNWRAAASGWISRNGFSSNGHAQQESRTQLNTMPDFEKIRREASPPPAPLSEMVKSVSQKMEAKR